jgi:hypothetical protein
VQEARAAAEPRRHAQGIHAQARRDAPLRASGKRGRRKIAADSGLLVDETLPFATEVGEAAAFSGGFAVGAIHVERDAPGLAVVTLGVEGQSPKAYELGPARGDVEPPKVTGRGSSIFFGVLGRESSGSALRIGKIEAGEVTWGATLRGKGGESQSFDLLAGDKKLVVVYDEETPAAASIQASTIDPGNVATATPPRPLTPSDKDVDSPRLAARPGGFWLAYVARRTTDFDADADYVAEDIGYRWIEIMPLDANGSPTAKPRAVTPADGHVMLFDIAPASDGGVLLVYRDDDTPTGSGGGRIMRVYAAASGAEPPVSLMEDDVGAGAPSLVGGWLAIADATGSTRLAPLSSAGDLLGPPGAEPDIGSGEPIAASERTLLIARPAGRDMRLVPIRCVSETPDAGADAATPARD